MDFTTSVSKYDMNYNLNAVGDYNQFLKNNSSFLFDDTAPTEFEMTLEKISKNQPIMDKKDPTGFGSLADKMGDAISSSLNAVNDIKLEANRMQEDIAMGGSTSIHDAMIAAEKASLSMQMAVQVRNRILSAYTELTSMGI